MKTYNVYTADFIIVGQLKALTPEAALAAAKKQFKVHAPIVEEVNDGTRH